jgi:ribonuclease HI
MKVKIYTDGSFKMKNSKPWYGGGIVFLFEDIDKPMLHKCAGCDTNIGRLRNVAGELMAVITAIGILDKLEKYTDVEIYHDYEGISKWVTGEWEAKKAFTKAYLKFMLKHQEKFNMTFIKVPAHAGVKYNEQADELAKQAIDEEIL